MWWLWQARLLRSRARDREQWARSLCWSSDGKNQANEALLNAARVSAATTH